MSDDPICEACGHPRSNHPYRHPFVGPSRDDTIKQQATRIEELEAEVARLMLLVPRPDQTEDELVWRDHMRGVPLAALAKEFGCTKERMRYRLKKIAENKLHLTGGKDAE